MKIQLRSPELAKRIATDFEKRYDLKGLRPTALDLTATQYGHESWQQLTQSVSPAAPDFVFDQDLPEELFEQRRIEQAQSLESRFDWNLPDALAVANALCATSDQSRSRRVLSHRAPAALRAMLSQRGVYWNSTVSLEHPLAPIGFNVGTFCDVAEHASRILSGLDDRAHDEQLFALVPADHTTLGKVVGGHTYHRRDQMLLIERVVWAAAIAPKKAPKVTDKEVWWGWYQSAQAATAEVALARAHYDMLLNGESQRPITDYFPELRRNEPQPGAPRRGVQLGAFQRAIMGKPWYWPLRPIIESPAHLALWHEADPLRDAPILQGRAYMAGTGRCS